VVTISRQVGSGAHAIAEQLANRLSPETSPQAAPWTVFDRNLIEKVLEDLRLPARLAQHLPEDRASDLEDIMDDLFGMRPPSWAVVQQTAETILRLARLGKVILIGRGATLVTARLPNVVRIRLVAPLEQRIALVQKTRKLTAKAAAAVVQQEDRGRARYLKKYFKADINNPLLYHLVINTGAVSTDEAVDIIAEALKRPVRAS
jgi:cytidylate kinase